MRKSRVIILCIALILAAGAISAVAGCGSNSSSQTIKIGAVLSLTGGNAPLGTAEQNAINLFVKQFNDAGGINGAKIDVIIKDDESNANTALDATNTLIEQENVVAVIGSSGTGPSLSMKNATSAASVPQIACAAGVSLTADNIKWIFRTPPTDAMAVQRALAFISGNLKKTNIAVLYDSNAFGTDGLKTIQANIAKYGLNIVASESYQTDETEEGMDTHLTKIQGSNPEILVVWGTNPGPAKIAVRMQAKGMTIPFVGSHGIANQKFLSDAGAAANGVYFPAGKVILGQEAFDVNSPQGKVVKKFVEDFTAEYGSAPDTFAGHGWDAVLITTEALKKTGTSGMDDLASFRSKLRDQIEKTSDLPGIGGVFTYSDTNHDGLSADDMLIVKVVNQKWTLAQ